MSFYDDLHADPHCGFTFLPFGSPAEFTLPLFLTILCPSSPKHGELSPSGFGYCLVEPCFVNSSSNLIQLSMFLEIQKLL
jgi:hypothetical protein